MVKTGNAVRVAIIVSLRYATRDGKTTQGDLGNNKAESSWIANKLQNRC